ncbi:winged helix-turn-helix transcriptional regulator [Nakamurella sp. YIM 132087]|uniref:Manganese transport regulator n=1 Tax=Nakamurella alba TaxID=2665158 RepID=A0A7K1FJP4_9ACTN|nr:metal-dependent transcriptional regulator [Nakamurella alba]MTD14355.1 winged helix-turn-helix transcriptional regulator [Nakamurella alba]
MRVSDLTTSAQNYLKIIWTLQEWSDAPVTTSIIAEKSGLRLSSVSDAVRRLTELGLLEHTPYKHISLTDQGRTFAVAMVRRHRLIETFLVQVLGYGWDEVHDEAENLEHAASDTLIDRIDRMLGHPTRDPHGDPIPSARGEVSPPQAVNLSASMTGRTVRVERISDASAPMLQYFAARGIVVDAELEVLPGEPFSDEVRIRVVGRDEQAGLGNVACAAIWVSGGEGS